MAMKNIKLSLHPGRLVLISFSLVIFMGALLLRLPFASRIEGGVSWINALFMSASATCVTGLSVLDVGTELTFFGQAVILFLIQIGGLGIMTLSVFIMLLFRQNVSLSSILSVNFQPQYTQAINFLNILVFVLGMTFCIEGLGAVLLFLRFRELHSLPEALFSSVFHSISAFCNAGFSLYPESLGRFQKETFIPMVFMGLIILGGLGFMLIDEIRVWMFRKLRGLPMKLSLHTKICLSMTAILIFSGAGVLYLLERQNLLEGLSGWQQAINAFFLSVTARTAGFNILETPSLSNATLFFLMGLMFVGACSGSTAGGVKVTTIAVLFALIRSKITQGSAALFNRKIPSATIIRSLSTFAASLFVILVSVFLFLVSEHVGVSHQDLKGSFLDQLFEVTSAFGTVGLSTGITEGLTTLGKSMIIFMMFAGRVGPLTLGVLFLSGKPKAVFDYVEEDVVIG